MIYANGKPVIIVCDNTAFVKKLDIISEIMKNSVVGLPYKGAKEHYVLDIDNVDLCRKVEFLTYDEGVCVQCMHNGSYDDELATINLMHQYMKENGYELDINDTRYHHEIYLSNPNKCDVNKLKTVIRHPIKKITK